MNLGGGGSRLLIAAVVVIALLWLSGAQLSPSSSEAQRLVAQASAWAVGWLILLLRAAALVAVLTGALAAVLPRFRSTGTSLAIGGVLALMASALAPALMGMLDQSVSGLGHNLAAGR